MSELKGLPIDMDAPWMEANTESWSTWKDNGIAHINRCLNLDGYALVDVYAVGVSCVCSRCETAFVAQGEFAVPQMGLGLELDQVMGIGPHLCESCRLDIPFPTMEELKEQADSYEECLF